MENVFQILAEKYVYNLNRCKLTWIAAANHIVWAAQWAWTARIYGKSSVQ